jgi:hypothetical protein
VAQPSGGQPARAGRTAKERRIPWAVRLGLLSDVLEILSPPAIDDLQNEVNTLPDHIRF